MKPSDFFFERSGCPFCQGPGQDMGYSIDYRETAEADPRVPNIGGRLLDCPQCGVTFSSHGCRLEAFALFYNMCLESHHSFDVTPLQRVRLAIIRHLWNSGHQPGSWLQWLARHSLNILHLPVLGRPLKGLRVLDVGAGLGEFMVVARQLGAEVVGTEVLPVLVDHIRRQGLECHLGEVDKLDLESNGFDVILCRAVLYRTVSPRQTLETFHRLLRKDGELALVDPCPIDGVDWFGRKQFPQGHFYIRDVDKYFQVLGRSGFECIRQHMIYGRPDALLKRLNPATAILCAWQILEGNLRRQRPYLLNYCCRKVAPGKSGFQEV